MCYCCENLEMAKFSRTHATAQVRGRNAAASPAKVKSGEGMLDGVQSSVVLAVVGTSVSPPVFTTAAGVVER